MEEMDINPIADRQWKGFDFNDLQFRALVIRTKLEIGKASVAGQYQQMLSSDNAGSKMVSKASEYMRYASYAFKAYQMGKKLWTMFRSKR